MWALKSVGEGAEWLKSSQKVPKCGLIIHDFEKFVKVLSVLILSIEPFHLKFLQPLWKILEKCTTEGMWMFICT